jgi:hypothetical protein
VHSTPWAKAKVEGGVLVAQRWILACLRNRRFFTLEELNAAIGELLEKLNTRPFQKLEGCRRSAFEKLDRPVMRPLPTRRYELGEWKLGVGVNIDYHFEYDHRVYSVPCELMNGKVDVRATAALVEAWHGGVRVTSHERSYGPRGTAVTKAEHQPRAHREWGNWPPERLVGWAAQTGPKTAEVVAAILARRTHPDTGRRACLGLMRMGERYGAARLEAACARAVAIKNPTYKSVDAILKTGLDKVTLAEEVEAKAVVHENIRGGAYFDREEVKAAESGNENENEARYLEEERLSIMNERRPGESQQEPLRSQQEVSGVQVREGADPAPRPMVMVPLPEMLGRLQALWTRPPSVRQPKRREVNERGGDDSHDRPFVGSLCASHGACMEEEPRQRERMCDVMTCESEEVWTNSPGPSGGEMR